MVYNNGEKWIQKKNFHLGLLRVFSNRYRSLRDKFESISSIIRIIVLRIFRKMILHTNVSNNLTNYCSHRVSFDLNRLNCEILLNYVEYHISRKYSFLRIKYSNLWKHVSSKKTFHTYVWNIMVLVSLFLLIKLK